MDLGLVRDWMSSPAVTVGPDADLMACANLLWDNHFRHLPVVDNGDLVGLIDDAQVFAEGAFTGTADSRAWVWFSDERVERNAGDLALPMELQFDVDMAMHDALRQWAPSGRDVAIVEQKGKVVGVLTEHDISSIAADKLPNKEPLALMGQPVTADHKMPPVDAMYLMGSEAIRHLVVTQDGHPWKVVSYRDLVATRAHGISEIGQVNQKLMITLDPDESLKEAATRMRDRHIGCLPVVKDGQIKGMVTRRDLLFALAR